MTEADWQTAGTHLDAMLIFLEKRTSQRKLRLFAAACVRRILDLLAGSQPARELHIIERYADGLSSESELVRVHESSTSWSIQSASLEPAFFAARCAAVDASYIYANSQRESAAQKVDRSYGHVTDAPRRRGQAGAHADQSDLIHCIFGNPFHPVALDPGWDTWQGSTVVRLAQAAYDERMLPSGVLDPARLGILADALEEAGCGDNGILSHLRNCRPHVRGCWVVDLLLDRR